MSPVKGFQDEKEEVLFDIHLPDLQRAMEAAFQVSAQPPLPDPQKTGALPNPSVSVLFEIIDFIGEIWAIRSHSDLTHSYFRMCVDLKTKNAPSYLTAYEMTIVMYRLLEQRLQDKKLALKYLYTPNPPDPPRNFDIVRAWVIREFLNLYVSRGSFRAYGWRNYPGFQGGPYNDPSRLPYRPCKGQS